MKKTTSEIRKAFLDYFASKNHMVMPSGPLVPAQDPSLMFANAGMVQFKNVFTGKQKRLAPCATTVQKCIRISGKHNDLENVGRTSRHHTFFEMLGNFSFGDYFKEEACRFGWEFLTKVLELDESKLWISVFKGDENAPKDEEAISIWTQKIGVCPSRILQGDTKDNFWAMGETGPCGPCSEIMYDRGDAFGEASLENGERFFEIWNLVFMQYMVENPGEKMISLPKPCIDTGAGLERIASVLQGVDSNYEIDIFTPLIQVAAKIAGKEYGKNEEDDVSLRVIADHARMAAHLISEGVFPEKTSREYVLRRVMRRAIRHGHRLGIEKLFFHQVALQVIEEMKDAYGELCDRKELIVKVCSQEEERFRQTLSRGLELLNKNDQWHTDDKGSKILPGEIAFDLSATYGFPLDLVEVIGQEEGFTVDSKSFEKAEIKHRLVSGAGKIGEAQADRVFHDLLKANGKTKYVGYEKSEATAQIIGIIKDGSLVETADEKGSTYGVVLDVTPLYGESGGQVGDTGEICTLDGTFEVKDTIRPITDLFVHEAVLINGSLKTGQEIKAKISTQARKAIARHHTATHLLHYAVRKTLGAHATQKGSRVSAESLRFDFTHFEAISREQLLEIEKIVTDVILSNKPVDTTISSYDDAKKSGAMALFEENYADEVRLVQVGDSKELCGGTHVSRSGDIGFFCILSEGSVSSGVRRIEAVCGNSAFVYIQQLRKSMEEASSILKTSSKDFVEKIKKLSAHEKELQKQVDKLLKEQAGEKANLLENVKSIGGIKVLGAVLDSGDPAFLRETADNLRQKLGSSVICLGGDNHNKAALVVAVTKDLKQFHAGKIVSQIALYVDGKGGGRPDLASAGGPDVSKIKEAVLQIYSIVENQTI